MVNNCPEGSNDVVTPPTVLLDATDEDTVTDEMNCEGITVLKFTENDDPLRTTPFTRVGFANVYTFPLEILLTLKEYHTPLLSVISAMRFEDETPADNVR
jgi:hypothetical protein